MYESADAEDGANHPIAATTQKIQAPLLNFIWPQRHENGLPAASPSRENDVLVCPLYTIVNDVS